MSPTQAPQALVIDSDSSAVRSTLHALQRDRRLSKFVFHTAVEADALQQLRQSAQAATQPSLVIIGPQVDHTAALTREMQRLCLPSHLLLLESSKAETTSEQPVHLPLAGLQWSKADIDDPRFADQALRAAQLAQQRMQLQSTLQRANRQISDSRQRGPHATSSLSDYYLSSFLSQVQDAIIATDAQRRVRYWSSGAERLFDVSESAAIGRPLAQLPFWSDRVEAVLADVPAHASTLSAQTDSATSEGVITLEIVCSAVRDDRGHFVGLALVVRDISERQQRLQAERAAHNRVMQLVDRERRHLRRLFRQAPGFIAITRGPQHSFEVVNDAFLEIVGRRSLLHRPAAEALAERQDQVIIALLDQVYASGKPQLERGFALAAQRQPDGHMETRYVDFVFQPIIEDDGTVSGIFCQGNDVTKQKLAQQTIAEYQSHLEELVEERTRELQVSQQALQQAQKLEAIGQLTGGVAHDFNNVLQIISGNLQLLQLLQDKKEAGDPETVRSYLNAAVQAVERGSKLSTQLLAFARRQPLEPVSLHLGRTLRSMDTLLQRVLGETIEVETVVAEGLWPTLVDPHQLENVVLNMAINARDAMPGGGKLTLEVANAALDEDAVISEPDVPPGEYVVLAISDTGHGMTEEVMQRAFEPFYTTKGEGQGTGLGLSMAYGFTKQSGGHIRIYSEPGHGTTFRIYLPRSFEKEVELTRPQASKVEGGTETILVVEDDAAVRETVIAMLKDLGYRVLQACDGESALSILQSGVKLDLLFTDVVMPGPLRSPDLARRARALQPGIAVLFTSGYTQNAIVHGGRLDPGVDLLSKPYRREDLASKLRVVLNKSREQRQEQRLRIIVVEDDAQGRRALCDLLEALGHDPRSAASAEEAKPWLQANTVDCLLTDLNLPGESGLDLARFARQQRSHLPIILASGGLPPELAEFTPPLQILTKPYGLDSLREALLAVEGRALP